MRRRAVLAGATGGLAALAGCSRGGGGGNDAEAASLDDWLGGLSEYDGVVDRTGEDEVTVAVGAGNDGLSFDPVAVAIDTGTTVVWEWTGRGGRHNVVERNGAFESPYHQDEGATFEHEFDESGVYPYYCRPHRSLGMKGGIRVT
jgi:plastocyanin